MHKKLFLLFLLLSSLSYGKTITIGGHNGGSGGNNYRVFVGSTLVKQFFIQTSQTLDVDINPRNLTGDLTVWLGGQLNPYAAPLAIVNFGAIESLADGTYCLFRQQSAAPYYYTVTYNRGFHDDDLITLEKIMSIVAVGFSVSVAPFLILMTIRKVRQGIRIGGEI